MPVNWLKLMSFAFGAAVAALTGTLFASLERERLPAQRSTSSLLITVYTMVILGGQGSQAGVVARRDPRSASCSSCCATRPRARPLLRRARQLVSCSRSGSPGSSRSSLAATIALRLRRTRDRGRPIDERPGRRRGVDGGRPGVSDWVIVPSHIASWIAPVSYVALIAAVLALTLAARLVRGSPCSSRRSTSPRSSGRTSCSSKPERDALHRPRRDPHRADDPAAERAARRAAGGDRLTWTRAPRAERASRSRSAACRSSRSSTSHVDEGEIVSVIGPNGAGKTTLFNLITGVYEPDEGDILLDGRSIVGLAAAQDQPARRRAHVPDAAAVPEHDGQGERDGGRLRPHEARPAAARCCARRGCAARSARSTRSPRSGSRSSASG